ncbi:hypothetical protein FWF93_00190 [Candidatus Saccharibacteria bacterium]|jgi:hypothetical protein|nr:hypothetical protein [Candidatus Saccharibacteria bacterium]
MVKRYLFYLFRWQLSTPILAIVLLWLSNWHVTAATVVANLIGGLIFFWVDKYIFKVEYKIPLWEIKNNVKCTDCGAVTRGYRLVKTKKYDRLGDKKPEFRCETCSENKLSNLRKKGVRA